MTSCPYCGHKLKTEIEPPKLSPKEFKVFNALIENGRTFTSVEELNRVIGAKEGSTIRVVIYNMNQKLKAKDMKIASYRGTGYRLEEA